MSSPKPSFLNRSLDGGRLILLNQVSKGAFGIIYTALGPANPRVFGERYSNSVPPRDELTRVYAVKELPLHRLPTYAKEATCHSAVSDCPNVLTLHHIIEEQDSTYLVMDYYPGGDLCTSLINHFIHYENVQHAKRISMQLVDAVQQCHDRGVYHRDLKPDNILLAEQGTRLVLADFGLATQQTESTEFGNGSLKYMSPECLGELHCTGPFKSAPNDVWGLGIVIFCIFMGHGPWAKPSIKDPGFTAYLLDPDFFIRRFPVSLEFHHLLMSIFTIDPSRRISMPDLAAALAKIDPSEFVYRDRPKAVLDTRSQYLRPITYDLTFDRVHRELAHLLDVERFLSDRSVEAALPAPHEKRFSLPDVLLRHVHHHGKKDQHHPARRTSRIVEDDLRVPVRPSGSAEGANVPAYRKWLGIRLPHLHLHHHSKASKSKKDHDFSADFPATLSPPLHLEHEHSGGSGSSMDSMSTISAGSRASSLASVAIGTPPAPRIQMRTDIFDASAPRPPHSHASTRAPKSTPTSPGAPGDGHLLEAYTDMGYIGGWVLMDDEDKHEMEATATIRAIPVGGA